jgi:hypothetical protein
MNRTILLVFGLLGLLFIFVLFALGPVNRQHQSWASARMQNAHVIGQMMLSYAMDHGGKYPDGSNSTEVFQKLLDGRYVNDPGIFYVPLFGKNLPSMGHKLMPDNVCWDITCCADSTDSDSLPLVFLTGYKVTYEPGGTAVLTKRLHPPFTRMWTDWWNGDPGLTGWSGIAVYYKGNKSLFLRLNSSENSNGIIPNFVPRDFDAQGKTYRQLTPDGSLP